MNVNFISGIPRSGSTLLCNILAQNPAFHLEGTSALCDTLVAARNGWDEQSEFRAMPHDDSERHKIGFLRGAFHGYFARHRDAVCFDKSRSWTGHVEMVEAVLVPPPCKIIVCIRDVRDVLASLESLWRKASATRQIPAEREDYHTFQSLPGRLSTWMDRKGLVGLPLNRTVDAVRRGYLDRLFFLPYEAWTAQPAEWLLRLHSFLDIEPSFEYDFDNVQAVIEEDDRAYDFPGLHQIRRKVEPQPSKWREVIGTFGEAWTQANELLFSLVSRPGNESLPDQVSRPGESTMPDASPPARVAEPDPLSALPHRNHQVPQAKKARSSR